MFPNINFSIILEICSTLFFLLFDKNLTTQGTRVGSWSKLKLNGPFLSSNHFGIFFQTPGKHCGTHDQCEITPALPKLVASPGSFLSIIVTSQPRSRRDRAQHTPMIPPPIIVTPESFSLSFST